MNPRFVQYLLERAAVTQDQLARAAEFEKRHTVSLDAGLIRLEILTLDQINEHLAAFYGVPAVRSTQLSRVSPAVIHLVPAGLARSLRLMPVEAAGKMLVVAMEDPSDVVAIDELRKETGLMAQPLAAPGILIDWALDKYYPGRGGVTAPSGQPPRPPSGELQRPPSDVQPVVGPAGPATAASPVAAPTKAAAKPAPNLQVASFEEDGAEFVGPSAGRPGPAAAAHDGGKKNAAPVAAVSEFAEFSSFDEVDLNPKKLDVEPVAGSASTGAEFSSFEEYEFASGQAAAAPVKEAPDPGGGGAAVETAEGVFAIEQPADRRKSKTAKPPVQARPPRAESSAGGQEFESTFESMEDASGVEIFGGGAPAEGQEGHRHVGPPRIDTREDLLAALPPELQTIDLEVLSKIPRLQAEKLKAIATAKRGSKLEVLVADAGNLALIEDLQFITGHSIVAREADEELILRAIKAHYVTIEKDENAEAQAYVEGLEDVELEVVNKSEEDVRSEQARKFASEEAPVVKLVNSLIAQAINRNASDIHIEPYENNLRVRNRVDGVLYEMMAPPFKLKETILARVKIMARMNITEQRLPQDGSMRLVSTRDGKRRQIDFRVSTLPTLYGEKCVLRILDKENLLLDMTHLGLDEHSLAVFDKAILHPYGMVLVVGPSGCGKTNTLYSALARLNNKEVNILTAEDPVEFYMSGINQVQMQDGIGLNFAAALRSFLRQDPDIVLVGEIRDFETAEIAIKASMTGHLVLSTLHTADAATTISRLMNMGIEPFLIASSLLALSAQRLIRKICPDCKVEAPGNPSVLQRLGFGAEEATRIRTYKGAGCDQCNRTGYRGRTGLFEVLEVTPAIRELIVSGATAQAVRKRAVEEGMKTLRESGLQKLRAGITTVSEVTKETVL